MHDGEDLVEAIFETCPAGSVPVELVNRLRAAVAGIRETQESIAAARRAFLAVGDFIKDRPDAEQAMHELGLILETLGVAEAVVSKGM
ncbi:MAG: hypothetical protein IT381_10395 [Deltaproteobacteria bacterium]|nr:hypothetical protein [Deltaproteobacteria bacterium]